MPEPHNSRLFTKSGIVAIVAIVATMSLEVHTTFCVQIGGKSLIACERVVSRGQSSVCIYIYLIIGQTVFKVIIN